MKGQIGTTLSITICFKSTKDRNTLLKEIVENQLIGFKPTKYNIDSENEFKNEQFITGLDKVEKTKGILIYGSNNELFSIAYPAIIDPPLVLTWTFEDLDANYSFIDKFVDMDELVCINIYDYWDVFWQSANMPSDYLIFDKDPSKLRRTKDKYDREIIDISNNYGRRVCLPNIWLMASPIMWFGKEYFELICDKQTLLKFPNSKELSNDLVYCELLGSGKMNNIDLGTLRKCQKNFRDLINADKIEKKLA